MSERLYPSESDPNPRTQHVIFLGEHIDEAPWPAEIDIYPRLDEWVDFTPVEGDTPPFNETSVQISREQLGGSAPTETPEDQPVPRTGHREASSSARTIGDPEAALTIISDKNPDQPAPPKARRTPKGTPRTTKKAEAAPVISPDQQEANPEADHSPAAVNPFDTAAAAEAYARGGEEGYLSYVANLLGNGKSKGKELELYRGIDDDSHKVVAIREHDVNDTDLRRAFTDILDSLSPEETKQYFADLNSLHSTFDNYTTLAAKRERLTLTPSLTEKKVEAARQEYEELRVSIKEFISGKLTKIGLSNREAFVISGLDDCSEVKYVGHAIRNKVETFSELSGPLAKQRRWFHGKWAAWGGEGKQKFFSKGNLKKAGVMGGVGFVVGIPAAIAGAALLGPIMGGAAAAAVARGVARGLVRGHLDKSAELTVAAAQMDRRITDARADLTEFYDPDDPAPTTTFTGPVYPLEITGAFADGTQRAVERNRRRMRRGAVIGALGGALGAFAAYEVMENLHIPNPFENHTAPKPGPGTDLNGPKPGLGTDLNGPKPGANPNLNAHPAPPAGQHPPAAPHKPEIVPGGKLYVEPGSGIIREIDEYASTHGQNISAVDASRIYENLKAAHGARFIDVSGTDTYNVGSDVRITHPGFGHWYPGVEHDINEQLAKLK